MAQAVAKAEATAAGMAADKRVSGLQAEVTAAKDAAAAAQRAQQGVAGAANAAEQSAQALTVQLSAALSAQSELEAAASAKDAALAAEAQVVGELRVTPTLAPPAAIRPCEQQYGCGGEIMGLIITRTG